MTDDKLGKPGSPMQQPKTSDRSGAGLKSSERGGARLGREIQAKLGQQLRAMYDDVVKEGVPDRFTDMLRQLDKPNGNDNEGSRG